MSAPSPRRRRRARPAPARAQASVATRSRTSGARPRPAAPRRSRAWWPQRPVLAPVVFPWAGWPSSRRRLVFAVAAAVALAGAGAGAVVLLAPLPAGPAFTAGAVVAFFAASALLAQGRLRPVLGRWTTLAALAAGFALLFALLAVALPDCPGRVGAGSRCTAGEVGTWAQMGLLVPVAVTAAALPVRLGVYLVRVVLAYLRAPVPSGRGADR